MLLVLVSLPAYAQELPPSDKDILKKEQTLVISKTPSRLEEPLEDASGSVSVVTEPEIEVQNPITPPEVLRDLPGVRLQETGTVGESVSVSLRGAEPSQTLVLLD